MSYWLFWKITWCLWTFGKNNIVFHLYNLCNIASNYKCLPMWWSSGRYMWWESFEFLSRKAGKSQGLWEIKCSPDWSELSWLSRQIVRILSQWTPSLSGTSVCEWIILTWTNVCHWNSWDIEKEKKILQGWKQFQK